MNEADGTLAAQAVGKGTAARQLGQHGAEKLFDVYHSYRYRVGVYDRGDGRRFYHDDVFLCRRLKSSLLNDGGRYVGADRYSDGYTLCGVAFRDDGAGVWFRR